MDKDGELPGHSKMQCGWERRLSPFLSADLDEMRNHNVEKISDFLVSLRTWCFHFPSRIFCEKSINPTSYRFHAVSVRSFDQENAKVMDYLTLNIEENEYRKQTEITASTLDMFRLQEVAYFSIRWQLSDGCFSAIILSWNLLFTYNQTR